MLLCLNSCKRAFNDIIFGLCAAFLVIEYHINVHCTIIHIDIHIPIYKCKIVPNIAIFNVLIYLHTNNPTNVPMYIYEINQNHWYIF